MLKIRFVGLRPSSARDLIKITLNSLNHYVNLPDDTIALTIAVVENTVEEGETIEGVLLCAKGSSTSKGLRAFNLCIKADHDIVSLVTSLAHEMIHVEQFVNERLVIFSKWDVDSQEDVIMSTWDGQLVEGISYHDLPWEIDAFERQDSLVEKLMNDKDWAKAVFALAKRN